MARKKYKEKPMYKEQQELIKKELRDYGLSDNLEEYVLVMTDSSAAQYHIDLGDGKFLFSQSDYKDTTANRFEDFRVSIVEGNLYSDSELEEFISGYYDTLETLKKEDPENWKMIALECGFEQSLV